MKMTTKLTKETVADQYGEVLKLCENPRSEVGPGVERILPGFLHMFSAEQRDASSWHYASF